MPKIFKLKLVRTENNKKIKEFKLEQNTDYIIGRSPQVDIIISHDSLSRKHAKIQVLKNSLSIQDLGSANGTYINKKQIQQNQEIILKDGTDIYLGECEDKLVLSEKIIETPEQSSEDEIEQETKEKQKKSKKSKKDKKEKNQKKYSSDAVSEVVEKPKKQKKQKNNKKSRSRSRSRSQEKQQKTQTETEQRNPSCNKQFGKEKAGLSSKFGNQKANVQQKRQLLWGNKEKQSISKDKQIWNNVNIDGDNKLKFMKLLGVKNVEEYKEKPKDEDEFIIKSAADVKVDKNQEINDNLEKQFYKSMGRKYMGSRGLGN